LPLFPKMSSLVTYNNSNREVERAIGFENLKVVTLKQMCRDSNLPVSGLKIDLVRRLEERFGLSSPARSSSELDTLLDRAVDRAINRAVDKFSRRPKIVNNVTYTQNNQKPEIAEMPDEDDY